MGRAYRRDVFGRLRAWDGRHPVLVDLLRMSPFLILIGLSILAYLTFPGANGSWSHILLSVLLALPLPFARRHPRTGFAIVAAISGLQWLTMGEVLMANISVVILMYQVASHRPLRWAVAAGLITVLGLMLITRWPQDLGDGSFVTLLFMCAAIWISGIYANTRRRYLEGLEERAERAERERDQQARIAAAEERARIARELHDVVAHNVSVIVVQADGACYAIDSDPEEARRAIQAISATGRRALAEMRSLVGVLRQDEDPRTGEEYTPQPGLAELDAMVAQVRSWGLPVETKISGTPVELPEGQQLAVYRIIQEALTNTFKHGGPGTRAWVELTYGPHEIGIRVVDDGRGAAAPFEQGGHGLVGMRERVAMYGGSLTTGPCPGGGYQVVARLPVASAGSRVA
ncbi:Signal transduction histidine kinase [Thermostaphylospora chromogena]|uniref:histidine kinase n=1 Tax=Thermostaphylospora chromogena TaxID=35622 RepID=A0A1H1F5G1_9ACTN|nr:Signal transduction histidine kinase [Thermostaphylospora chromogena]